MPRSEAYSKRVESTISSGDGEDTAAPCALRAEVWRTFVNGVFGAHRSPFLSTCNPRLNHDKNRVKDQGDPAGWQSYYSEPSHHAEGIKRFSDIDTENNARRWGTLVHRASEDHGRRTDNQNANEGKHSPRDENAIDDGVAQTVIHVRMLLDFQRASKRALAHSFR